MVSELIAQREQEEALQREAEERLAAEQAARAEEDARLRELYPLPEDEEEYGEAAEDVSLEEVAYEEAVDPEPSDADTLEDSDAAEAVTESDEEGAR